MLGWNLPFRSVGKVHVYARRQVRVPESNFFIRVAPAKPAQLVPFQAGANNKENALQQEALGIVGVERRANATTGHALAWLRGHHEERFFVWVHDDDPHFPDDPPKPFYASYYQDLYSGEIAYVDEQAGRVLNFLNQTGVSGHALVIGLRKRTLKTQVGRQRDLIAASAATESRYLVSWPAAVSSSSAFCQLEFGLYSFIALPRASVFFPRSF